MTIISCRYNDAEQRRIHHRNAILSLENRQRNIEDLRVRFALLDEQYAADSKRIESISETAFYLDHLKAERCPICGSQSEHHTIDHASHSFDSKELLAACKAEEVKTKTLNQNLESARIDLDVELTEITSQIENLSVEYDQICFEIDDLLKPKHSELVNQLKELHELKSAILSTVDKKDHLDELYKIVERLRAPDESNDDTDEMDDKLNIIQFYDELSQLVLQELKNWNFPEVNRVSFDQSYNVFDFIINGKIRNSHGKGVRAILYASVLTALFKYCVKKDMPHPGFLVIDSPLVVYRKPDSDESNFDQDVQGAMYRSLSESLKHNQVIIAENVEPPANLAAKIIHFTKSKNGRYGFIPAKKITEN